LLYYLLHGDSSEGLRRKSSIEAERFYERKSEGEEMKKGPFLWGLKTLNSRRQLQGLHWNQELGRTLARKVHQEETQDDFSIIQGATTGGQRKRKPKGRKAWGTAQEQIGLLSGRHQIKKSSCFS